MQNNQSTDIAQRDDIIIFSENLSKSSHNIKHIKNYRKFQQEFMGRNEGLPTESTNDRGFVFTIDNSERIIQHQSQQKMRINLQSLPMRRNSVTAGNTRRRHYQNIKTQARTLNLSNNISSMRQQPQPSLSSKRKQTAYENKYAQIEKKFNKGPIRDKYLSCWLNSLLLQACHDQKFDSTIQNPALKKYGLDENSLRSKGIKPDNLNRIYKCLFVYSVGFNDLLKEICGSNMNLRKTIWKVFAILLQYCSQGSFETMIAEIQRDKLQKIESLTNQIMKRQKVIQNNTQINENKNAKIYKQIKQLRDQNSNLMNQKQVLLQQFKQAEQAFNQQVTLRLKFQNKINEIHGVFTELQNKHLRLQHDHIEATKQLTKLRSLTTQQTKIVTDLKKDNEYKTEQLVNVQRQLKYKIELIGMLEQKKHGDANTNIESQNSIKDLKSILDEKTRQISQLTTIINNTTLIYQTQKLEHQQTAKQLSNSLQQNAKLHATIASQMKDLNDLLYEKRNFGLQTSQIQAAVAVIQGKLKEQIREKKILLANLEKQQQELRKAKTQLQTQKKLRTQAESDLHVCHDNIKQMKKAKNEMEQDYTELKRKFQSFDEIIESKQKQISQLKRTVQELNYELNSANIALRTLQSNKQLLNERLKSFEEISNKRYNTLRAEKQTIEKNYLQFSMIKQSLELERDKLKSQFEAAELNFKNEKFQRTNLSVYYQNSLNTGQEKSEQIKKLDIIISQLQEQIEDLKRKAKSVEFINNEKDKQYQKQKHFWNEKIKKLSQQNSERTHYIHPMIFEDVAQNYQIKTNNLSKLKEATDKQRAKLNETIQIKNSQIKQLKQRNAEQISKMREKYEAVIIRKQNELQYETNRNAHLSQTAKQLELELKKYTGSGKQLSHEREQKYLVDIKNKKQQIQSLFKDLQKAHDANKTLRQNFILYETSLPEKQKQLQILKQEIVIQKTKYEDHIDRKDKQIQKKKQQIQKLKQQVGENKRKIDKTENSKSKQMSRKASGNKYGTLDSNSGKQIFQAGTGPDTKRNDFAKKYKGAYIYYNK